MFKLWGWTVLGTRNPRIYTYAAHVRGCAETKAKTSANSLGKEYKAAPLFLKQELSKEQVLEIWENTGGTVEGNLAYIPLSSLLGFIHTLSKGD